MRILVVFIGSVMFSMGIFADSPKVKTPAPVIYLADNLDESQSLGWCLDTVGRGFSDKMHAHSCKPQGGDVQFTFHADSGQIRSAAFTGYCMTLNDPSTSPDTVFGLSECSDQQGAQQFDFDAQTQRIRLTNDNSQCVVVGEKSRAAGPFMSRDLTIAACMDTTDLYARWVVVQ